MTTKKTALLSVSDKSGITEFARQLRKLGFELISTGGTAALLRKQKIPVTEVADLTGFPEILGGRVKTLHPKVFGGILARGDQKSATELRKHAIKKIDLVCVNLYPFAKTISKKEVEEAEAIEEVDIGGVALLRAAAKNFERVIVVSDPGQYGEVAEKLRGNALNLAERKELAAATFTQTHKYDYLIAEFLGAENPLPVFEFMYKLRYGENPHQEAFLYHEVGNGKACVANAEVLQGKELSFNNLMDADYAIRIPFDFTAPTVAVVKHANPCGVASSSKIEKALQKALDADKKSPFGGIIALNRTVNKACATTIRPLFMEVIIAPDFDSAALKILAKKKNLRLLAIGDFKNNPAEIDLKKIGGGVLVQKRDTRVVTVKDLKVVSKRSPTAEQLRDLIFAANICKHAKSNAIVLAKNEIAVGIGAGQTARVDAVEIAAAKAGSRASGSVLASDAFFPFPDGVEAAAAAGVTAIIQPGGSIRDREVIRAADAANIAMVFSGVRGFKH
ncbi:MAG: bifunctional phosphoribosylaminoimidazolecarboxamide formyltransferase/IMP cyclohydrolase [Patescibacteria group bacterium]